MSRIKTMLLSLVATLGLMFPIALPATAELDPINVELCKGISLNANLGDCDTITSGADSDVNEIAKNVVDVLTWIVGIVSVIMIIVAGLRYITSGGESGKVGGAKNTILYAVIGIVIVVVGQTLVKWILDKILTTQS